VHVYLCRHAAAAPGEPDELRELTQDGVEQARQLGRRLAGTGKPPRIVVSNPLERAKQTAEAVSRETRAELRIDPRLAPGAGVDELQAVLDGLVGPVATVGHQPDCSEIAVALTGTDPGFPPAGFAAIQVDS
jgi:phosphohistidine phosphatase